MAKPTRNSATTTSQLVVDWTTLVSPANGDATIQTYALEWDAGNGGTSYTAIHGVSPFNAVDT